MQSLPGKEVLQRSGLVLFLTDDAVPLLLLHLSNARGERVDVVEHGLHGDWNLIRLLTKEKKDHVCTQAQSFIQF